MNGNQISKQKGKSMITLCDELSGSDRTSRMVAVIKEPNGISYLHEGHFTDDVLNNMIMHLPTFLASDFDLIANPNGLV